MHLKISSVLYSVFLLFTLTSFGQANEWDKLGSRAVNYNLNKDTILVGEFSSGFTKLRIKVTGGDINMHRMIIHYIDGTTEPIELKRNFNKTSVPVIIDTHGGKKLIRDIIFNYDTKKLIPATPIIHVYGKHYLSE